MPHLHRYVLLVRYIQVQYLHQILRPRSRIPLRLPPRRNSPRSLQLDPPPLDNCHLPYEPASRPPSRNQNLYTHILKIVSVLALRVGLSGLDEGGQERAASELERGVWTMDV